MDLFLLVGGAALYLVLLLASFNLYESDQGSPVRIKARYRR